MELDEIMKEKVEHLKFVKSRFPSMYQTAIVEIREMAMGKSCYGLREQCYTHPDNPDQTVPNSFFVELLQELGEKA